MSYGPEFINTRKLLKVRTHVTTRSLSGIHVTALGINAIIGAGIFMFPGTLAAKLGWYSIPFYLFCGLLLTLVALTFSSLAKLTERNGGPYVYAAMAFGPKTAFFVGWSAWVAALVSAGAVGGGISFYLNYFLAEPLSPEVIKMVSAGLILFFGTINYFGVNHGSLAMLILTIAKVVPLVAVALYGFIYADYSQIQPLPFDHLSTELIGQGLILAVFTCQGFEVVPLIAGEVKNAKKVIPTAIITSLWLAVGLYMILQIGIVSGPAVGSSTPLATLAKHLWGDVGGSIIAMTGLISVIGFLSGIALGAPRYLSPLSEDGLLPKKICQEHPIYKTPSISVALTTGLSALFVLVQNVSELVSIAALSVALQYLFASFALIKLYGKHTKFLALGISSCLVSSYFLYQIKLNSWLAFGAVSILGVVIHLIHSHRQKGYENHSI